MSYIRKTLPLWTLLLLMSSCYKQPTACFDTGTNQYLKLGAETEFDGSCSNQGQKWTWDFGDGSATVTGTVVTHTFQKEGDYSVKLVVKNGTKSDDVTTVFHVQR